MIKDKPVWKCQTKLKDKNDTNKPDHTQAGHDLDRPSFWKRHTIKNTVEQHCALTFAVPFSYLLSVMRFISKS